MMCWAALDRAQQLAAGGHIPAAHVPAWRAEADAIREFIETSCWSARLDSYTRDSESEELDASVLLGILLAYDAPDPARLASTVTALRRTLGHGPLLHRYTGDDGLSGDEGAFLCCSFWLADALARIGQPGEAGQLMDELLTLANDLGLHAEEVDPGTGEMLGNFPQGLVHLALINAAVSIAEATAA
jgi:GH15 family glucan-1,4-alpha-glucosidase